MGVANRAWMVLPAALGAALAVGVGSGPAATRASHPSARVGAAKVSGAYVAFAIDVAFPVPARAKASRACRGSVKLSAAKRHWKAPLAAHGAACRARIHGRLPKAKYGRTVAFRFAFAGNASVAPFSRTAKLKLSPPAPGGPTTQPTTPAQTTTTTQTTPTDTTPTQTTPPSSGPPDYVNGSWVQNGPFPGASAVEATVTGGKVTNVSASLQVMCDSNSVTYALGYHYTHEIGVLPDGSFSGDYQYTTTGVDLHLSASGTLGNGTGTLTISATGSDFGQTSCHGTATGPIAKS